MNIGDYAVVTELVGNDKYAGVIIGDIVSVESIGYNNIFNCSFGHKLKQCSSLNDDGTFKMKESQLKSLKFIPRDIVRHEIYGIGTVMHVSNTGLYAVEFEKSRSGFHSCNGYCSAEKGHYCIEKHLELVKMGEREMGNGTTMSVKKRMRQSDIIQKKMMELAKSTGINIKEIEEIQPNKIYILHQKNGSKIKTVCHHGDVFSRETAAMIMIAKADLGGNKFNYRVKKLLQYWELQDKYKAELEKEEVSRQKKQKKWAEHKKAAERRAKEARIEEKKEAYIRAIRELGVDTATLVPEQKAFLPDENRR